MIVNLVNFMGTDMTVCDAARVSMAKTSYNFTDEQNAKLITYLARHAHWSPFAHCMVQFRFSAPIFVARQLQKHQIGFAWNEVSRRYVSEPPAIWTPSTFRDAAESVKQGSKLTENKDSDHCRRNFIVATDVCRGLYVDMINRGVCPEQARAILPQAAMTEWMWTGSLYAWSRMYRQRIDPHAQLEVREYAQAVSVECSKLFPLSWTALIASSEVST